MCRVTTWLYTTPPRLYGRVHTCEEAQIRCSIGSNPFFDWLASCFDGSAASSRFAVGSLDLSSFPALVAHDAFSLVDQGSTHAGNTTRRCRSVVPACLHGQRHAVHRQFDGGAVL